MWTGRGAARAQARAPPHVEGAWRHEDGQKRRRAGRRCRLAAARLPSLPSFFARGGGWWWGGGASTPGSCAALPPARELTLLPLLVRSPWWALSAPPGLPSPAGQAPPELVCLAALPFLSMSLGVLLPTALAAYCWRSPAADAEHETGRGASADSFAGATPQLSGAAAGSGRKAGSALRGAAAAAAGAANRMLRTVFCSEKGTQSRALACWWFSALFWWLCSRLGGRLY